MLARAAVLVCLLALAGGLAARRARLLDRLVRLGRPVERAATCPPSGPGGHGGARPAQALPAGPPRPDARVHLLGVPGPADHDRRGASARWSIPTFALPLDRRRRVARARPGRVRGRGAGGIAIAVVDPGRAAARAIRRQSHRLEAYRILGLIPGSSSRCSCCAARGSRWAYAPDLGWTPVSTAVSAAVHVDERGLAAFFDVDVPVGAPAADPGLPRLPRRTRSICTSSTSAINVWFASTRPRGTLEPLRIDIEKLEAASTSLGAATMTDLTRKELLDLYACTECGRCQSVCPAWNTGKPLSPKLLDHGPARSPARGRARASWRRWQSGGDAGAGRARAGHRSTTTSCGRARRAAPACRSVPSTSNTSTRSSTCAAAS